MFSRYWRLSYLLLAALLIGCAGQSIPSPTAASLSLPAIFPGADAIAGWTPTDQVKVYNHDHLFDLVDGQADGFFVYGFQQVATQRYKNTAGTILGIEVWQLATPADAYGLYTSNISGAPATIGNDGDAEPGRRLSFWQDRYTVHVTALQKVDDAVLSSFAKAISQALPPGGERPALVNRLPSTGLKERGFVFFHEEISIQDQIWLGGKNILGLSHDTNGIVAQYNLSGQAARLLLIQYPDADKAATGLNALKSSSVKNLVATNAVDNLLGAVFGAIDPDVANKLLDEALR
jgi:hypothetical protein